MSDFHERKAQRKEAYYKWEFGWVLQDCTACNGSGRYDHNGSPPCGCCEGTGKERVRGEKTIKPQDYQANINDSSPKAS